MPLYNFKIKETGKDWDDIPSRNFNADSTAAARDIAVTMSSYYHQEVRYNEAGSHQGHYVRAYDETDVQNLLKK